MRAAASTWGARRICWWSTGSASCAPSRPTSVGARGRGGDARGEQPGRHGGAQCRGRAQVGRGSWAAAGGPTAQAPPSEPPAVHPVLPPRSPAGQEFNALKLDTSQALELQEVGIGQTSDWGGGGSHTPEPACPAVAPAPGVSHAPAPAAPATAAAAAARWRALHWTAWRTAESQPGNCWSRASARPAPWSAPRPRCARRRAWRAPRARSRGPRRRGGCCSRRRSCARTLRPTASVSSTLERPRPPPAPRATTPAPARRTMAAPAAVTPPTRRPSPRPRQCCARAAASWQPPSRTRGASCCRATGSSARCCSRGWRHCRCSRSSWPS
jgi:hypothetical protein